MTDISAKDHADASFAAGAPVLSAASPDTTAAGREGLTQHFVEFMSPGTFVPEVTTKPIDAWDTDIGMAIATEIVERHSARPYGFRFITRSRGPGDLDSKVTARSGVYYLGGKVYTADEVLARNDPKEQILRSNIRANRIKRIIVNDNSWRFTAALEDGDVVLDFTMPAREARHG